MSDDDAAGSPRASWLRRLAPKPRAVGGWREIGSNLGELAAIGAISHGFWLIMPSLGWISAGLGVGAVSFAVSRGDNA